MSPRRHLTDSDDAEFSRVVAEAIRKTLVPYTYCEIPENPTKRELVDFYDQIEA